MLECVVNLSEGRQDEVIGDLVAVAGAALLDVHRDPWHNRSVLTLAGDEVEQAARRLSAGAVAALDLRRHQGVHPRFGVVDVVPFVPLDGSGMAGAVAARDRFAAWAARELGVPCFLYGPERTLPEVRRTAFRTLAPDTGPPRPHPTAGAMAVGARPVMIAYNLWLAEPDVELARRLASELRGPAVRALGFELDGRAQVSFNLVDPARVGPADVWRAVSERTGVDRAELVGLVPKWVVDAVEPGLRDRLDLNQDRTIDARLRGP